MGTDPHKPAPRDPGPAGGLRVRVSCLVEVRGSDTARGKDSLMMWGGQKQGVGLHSDQLECLTFRALDWLNNQQLPPWQMGKICGKTPRV